MWVRWTNSVRLKKRLKFLRNCLKRFSHGRHHIRFGFLIKWLFVLVVANVLISLGQEQLRWHGFVMKNNKVSDGVSWETLRNASKCAKTHLNHISNPRIFAKANETLLFFPFCLSYPSLWLSFLAFWLFSNSDTEHM